MNLPNIITLARILLVPVFVVIYLWPGDGTYLIAATLFALAAATDWLDGYLARRLNQTTPFGAFLDPVADKLMVCTVLIILVDLERVDAVIGIIIVGREIAVSALREWMLKLGSKRGLRVDMLGKLKTCSQMVALPCLLYNSNLFIPEVDCRIIGTWLVGFAAILTVISFFNYIIIAVNDKNIKDEF